MGGSMSTVVGSRAKKAWSDEIDKQIAEDEKRFKKECKVLLLGSGESGISTIVKQMKIAHGNGFSDTELAAYRPVVFRNVIESAHQVVNYMKKAELSCVKYSNRALVDKILDFQVTALGDTFPSEIAEAIDQLWNDPIIPKIMDEHSSKFYLMDSAEYFLSHVLRISQPDYLPDNMDALRAHEKLVGISETTFTMGQLLIRMFHVGGLRSERKKWIHCFESVTSIIFCTALTDYDQVLREEKTQNRMAESLILFESVINSRWFLRTSIILMLTKFDVFRNKITRVPLERYFPEYTGGPDANRAAKYILWKFMQANRAQLSVYPHLTQATDVTNIRLVFAAVKETVLQNAIKDSKFLRFLRL